MYRLQKTSIQVAQVMTSLAVGVGLSDCVIIFDYQHTTITRWLSRAGQQGAAFHNRYFREFEAGRIRLDELKTKVVGLSPQEHLHLDAVGRTASDDSGLTSNGFKWPDTNGLCGAAKFDLAPAGGAAAA